MTGYVTASGDLYLQSMEGDDRMSLQRSGEVLSGQSCGVTYARGAPYQAWTTTYTGFRRKD